MRKIDAYGDGGQGRSKENDGTLDQQVWYMEERTDELPDKLLGKHSADGCGTIKDSENVLVSKEADKVPGQNLGS